MSKQVVSNYTFSTSAKTITLTDFTTVRLDRLALITDVTTNAVLFNFADSTIATATVSGNVITLSTLPGGVNNSDKLRIDYDVITGDPTYDTPPIASGAATAANQATANAALGHLTDNTQTTRITNGTQSADTIAGDSGQNSLLLASGRKELASLSAGALNADLVPSTDVSNYRSVSLHVTGTYSGTLTFQGSNDNSNWVSVGLERPDQFGPGSIAVSTNSTGLLFTGALRFRYFRVRMTAYTSGTATGTCEFFTVPQQPTTVLTGLAAPGTLADATSNPNTTSVGAHLLGYNSSTWDRLTTSNTTTDAKGGASQGALNIMGYNYIYNGANWDRRRTPNIFKTASVTASGNSAVWTPTAGKKFRLMKFMVMVSANAATSGGGVITVNLQDGSTASGLSVDCFVPATAVTTAVGETTFGPYDLGNGMLSSAANNVLNANLSAAVTSGAIRVLAIGTEE